MRVNRTFRRDRNHRTYIKNCFVRKRYLKAERKRQRQQATFDILKFSHDSEGLGPKLQICTTPLSHILQKRLEHKENQTKYRKMTRKPRGHVRVFIA